MQDIFAFLITLAIFILIIWGSVKLIKKIIGVTKSIANKARNNLVSSDVKAQREEAKRLIRECVASEVISDEQKKKAFTIINSLPLSYRESELKTFVNTLDINALKFSDFDKINDLADCLNVSIGIIDNEILNLSTIMFEKELRAGRVEPNVFSSSIPLKRDEIIYFKADSRLVGTKATREYRSGSQGVSFRIAKGVYYRVGASKGRSESIKQDILKSDGELIITNRRIVFAGEIQSFEVYSNKIINYLFKDGVLIINVSHRQEPHRVIVPDNLIGCFDAAIQLSLRDNNE